MRNLALSAAAAASFVAGSTELAAQTGAERPRYRQVVVYGNDPCPRDSENEIVICARRPETERFRVPENLRTAPPGPDSQAWQNRARELDEVQEAGIGSCTTVGPGGQTGCLQERIEAYRAERGADAGDQPQR